MVIGVEGSHITTKHRSTGVHVLSLNYLLALVNMLEGFFYLDLEISGKIVKSFSLFRLDL